MFWLWISWFTAAFCIYDAIVVHHSIPEAKQRRKPGSLLNFWFLYTVAMWNLRSIMTTLAGE